MASAVTRQMENISGLYGLSGLSPEEIENVDNEVAAKINELASGFFPEGPLSRPGVEGALTGRVSIPGDDDGKNSSDEISSMPEYLTKLREISNLEINFDLKFLIGVLDASKGSSRTEFRNNMLISLGNYNKKVGMLENISDSLEVLDKRKSINVRIGDKDETFSYDEVNKAYSSFKVIRDKFSVLIPKLYVFLAKGEWQFSDSDLKTCDIDTEALESLRAKLQG